MNNNFTHLHVHTEYSLLDGYGKCSDRVKKAKELGMNAIAITDHNQIGGCLDFYTACKSENIKPILGVELYYTEDINILNLPKEARDLLAIVAATEAGVVIPKFETKKIPKQVKELISDYQVDTKSYHIIFLAKNQIGWQNLVKLQSAAAKECSFNGNFTCDDNMIVKYKEGLIMTTACISSIIANYIKKGDRKKATEKLDKWKSIFGEDFYLEIQPWHDESQAIYNMFLIDYSNNTNTPLITTNDVHYTTLADIDYHDTLLCIGTGKLKSDENRMKYAPEFWVRNYDEMIEAFIKQYEDFDVLTEMTLEQYLQYVKTGLYNTNLVADKISNDIKLGSDKAILPKVHTSSGLPPKRDLTFNSFRNLYKYLEENNIEERETYLNRLSFELNVINTKGYADYMLIVKELIDWCESEDIPVGPGRGSASGSLVLFINGITKCIDPIKYGLLFSRFLTMDRTSLPDIDSDFSYRNRGRVIQHLKDKYGEDCVCNIGTYTDMGIKTSLKDVGRTLGIAFDVMNTLSKKVDLWTNEEAGFKFEDLDSLASGNDLDKKFYEEFQEWENKYPYLFKTARALEGTHRNQGTHASGILVTPMPINDMFPTRLDDKGRVVTLFTGTQCESLGSCKLDILGLKTLDILDLTIKAKNKKDTVYNLYKKVDNYLNDVKMFNALNNKETEGIFQLESKLFKGLIKDIRPNSIEDITVITSLGRPGPLAAGLHIDYANVKNGVTVAAEPLPETWDIVMDSNGVMCYQEHAMRIAQKVAGFNDNQADSFLRKAMAKKKRALIELCNQWFVYGKINAIPPDNYDPDNKNQPYYDPEAKYGDEINGGIANGYDEHQLIAYNNKIDGFSSYLFNKSHAIAYSFLTLCCMYLKTYHKKEFFAALLSLQDKQEDIALYIKTAKKYGIEVKIPDINISEKDFIVKDKAIYYSISCIKNVGEASVPYILNNRPYKSIQEARDKIVKINNDKEKKLFDKKVGEALIKAGAFDSINPNRNELLNEFQIIRKAKGESHFDVSAYNKSVTTIYEKETLGISVTNTPFWDTIDVGKTVTIDITITDRLEHIDRNENLMAFVTALIGDDYIKGLVFANTYCKNISAYAPSKTPITAKILKAEDDNFIIKDVVVNQYVN